MSLDLRPVKEQIARDFAQSANHEMFEYAFVASINDIFDELTVAGDLDTALSHVDTHDTIVDALDNQHTSIIRRGLYYYLIQRGNRPKDNRSIEEAKRQWEDAKGDFMMIEQRKLEDTVDDNDVPTGDVVGLGYKG